MAKGEVKALGPAELAAGKAYLRVEGDEEDELILGLLLAARTYLEQAGISVPEMGSARRAVYDLCCHGLALGWYERREIESEWEAPMNRSVRMLLNQLKWTEPEEMPEKEGGNEDTESS